MRIATSKAKNIGTNGKISSSGPRNTNETVNQDASSAMTMDSIVFVQALSSTERSKGALPLDSAMNSTYLQRG